jgi:hypothetical protein
MSEPLEAYLHRLERALEPLSATERQEIVRETRSHVLDRLSAQPSPRVETVLRHLGPADEYAEQFLAADPRVRSATRPAESLARIVTGSLKGFLVFNVVVVLYGLGLLVLGVAVLKAFRPDHVGLWSDPETGMWTLALAGSDRPSGVEVLGWWLFPIALAVALVIMLPTTVLLRHLRHSIA